MKGADADVLVIDGGPAGAAALLARRGVAVEVLEQSAGAQHKVCGEFLSHEAVSYLVELGVDLRAMGAAPMVAQQCGSGRRCSR